LFGERARRPVETSKQVGWLQITLIKVGIFISLPGFVTGVKIGNAVGYQSSVIAFFVAGVVLGSLASVTGSIGAKTRLSTYVIVQHTFGTKGAILINMIFALSLFGWFGINTALFGSAVVDAITVGASGGKSWIVASILGGTLMVATAIFGFKALDMLSRVAVPVLIIALTVLVYASISQIGMVAVTEVRESTMSLGNAISAVIGGSVVGTVIFPDVCRYAKSFPHAIVAAILTFMVGKPLILMSSAIPALATGEAEIMRILSALGLGVLALGIVIFTTWTSNNGNLYAASLSLSTVVKGLRYWQLVIIAGVLGTVLAISGVLAKFVPFLHMLGIAMPPVAGIYAVHYFFIAKRNYSDVPLSKRKTYYFSALVAWLVACIIGVLALNEVIVVTTVPALDSLISAAVIYLVLKKLSAQVSDRKPAAEVFCEEES